MVADDVRVVTGHLTAEEAANSARQYALEMQERMRLIVETSSDLITRHAPDGTFLYVSPASRRLIGWEPNELIGRTLFDLVHPDDIPDVAERIHAIFDEQDETACYRMRRRDGSYGWFEATRHTIRVPGSRAALEVHVSSRDVSDRVEAEAERDRLLAELERTNVALAEANDRLERLAHVDELTGLPNRRLLESLLSQMFGRARRTSSDVAVLFIDLDAFKPINDTLGHAAGDELLVRFAQRVQRLMRDGDVAARWGGDEFVVVVEPAEGLSAVSSIAARIVDAGRVPFELDAGTVTSTVSVGVATGSADDDPATVLAAADDLLYDAKASGGDRWRAGRVGRGGRRR